MYMYSGVRRRVLLQVLLNVHVLRRASPRSFAGTIVCAGTLAYLVAFFCSAFFCRANMVVLCGNFLNGDFRNGRRVVIYTMADVW